MNLTFNLVEPLLSWYQKNARSLPWRQSQDAYRVWVSEIMLQQTRVEAVKGYYARFLAALPTLADLATCPEETLLKLWQGLGYYNRVRNMQKAAIQVMQQYAGEMPRSYQALLQLPGIGAYTAGAVASIAYGIAVPAVDGNVLRVITRITANHSDITKPAVKTEITEQLAEIIPQNSPGNFNQALMELGATVCVPNGAPQCLLCPLRTHCKAFAQGITDQLPVKTKQKPRRIEERTVLLLLAQNRVALQQRGPKQVLAGLWQFPNIEGLLSPAAVTQLLEQWQIGAEHIKPGIQSKHIFTHIEWHMQSYVVTCTPQSIDLSEGVLWASLNDFDTLALPTAFQPFFKAIQPHLQPDIH